MRSQSEQAALTASSNSGWSCASYRVVFDSGKRSAIFGPPPPPPPPHAARPSPITAAAMPIIAARAHLLLGSDITPPPFGLIPSLLHRKLLDWRTLSRRRHL